MTAGALGLVCRQLEERLLAHDVGSAALLVLAGQRLLSSRDVLESLDPGTLDRFRALARRARVPVAAEGAADLVDRLAAAALAGRRPGIAEAYPPAAPPR